MSGMNWQRQQQRITARDVRRKSRDLDSWLAEYGRGRARDSRQLPPRHLGPSLVKLHGSWHAVVPGSPAIGDIVSCTHADTGRSGDVRVTSVVWSQRGRSLVRVARL